MSLNTKLDWNAIQCLINQVEAVSGTNKKLQVLSEFPCLRDLLAVIIDKKNTTGVTAAGIKKFEKKFADHVPKQSPNKYYDEPLSLLMDLVNRTLTGHDAKYAACWLCKERPGNADAITRVACGNLKLRLQAKQVNKIFPGLVEEFSCALAEDFCKRVDHMKQTLGENWYASRKYDGVRMITIVRDGAAQCFSRTGNRFSSLQLLEEFVSAQSGSDSFVLDGEICVVDQDGNENFRESVSQVKRKSEQMRRVRYFVFDMIPLDTFYDKERDGAERMAGPTFSARQKELAQFMTTFQSNEDFQLELTTQAIVQSMEHLNELFCRAIECGWEGLILRKDHIYEGKRSKNVLKRKEFPREEFIVEEVQFSEMQIIQDGAPTTVDVLKSVGVRHKDKLVFVGSGFTVQERRHFVEHPEDIMGKTITVQYFEETESSDGTPSLRFPTIKCVHGDKREV